MNNNVQNTNANSQSWVLSAAPGSGPFNYAVVRPPPPAPALAIPPQQSLVHPYRPSASPQTSLSSPLAHQQTPQSHTPPVQTPPSLLHQSVQQPPLPHPHRLPPKYEDQQLPMRNQPIDFQQNHPQQSLHASKQKPSRAVIPSKRAAQNRAAQKAFRQRREQYIKELEQKAKEMDEWHEELDTLRKENGTLRKKMALLEKEFLNLTGGDTSKIVEIDDQLRAEAEAAAVTNANTSTTTTTTMIHSDGEFVQSPERAASLSFSQMTDSEGTVESSSRSTTRESTSPVSHPSVYFSSGKQPSHTESRLRHEQLVSEQNSHSNSNVGMPRKRSESEGAKSYTSVTLQQPMPNEAAANDGTAAYNQPDHTKNTTAASATSVSESTNDVKRRKLDNTVFAATPDHVSIPATPPQPTQVVQTNISDAENGNISSNHPLVLPMQQQQQQQPIQQQQNMLWNQQTNATAAMNDPTAAASMNAVMTDFDLDFDFDPFFEDEFGPTLSNSNDFLPNANSGQVLDDLFAMLQTRQRPQIPIIPAEEAIAGQIDMMPATTTTTTTTTAAAASTTNNQNSGK